MGNRKTIELVIWAAVIIAAILTFRSCTGKDDISAPDGRAVVIPRAVLEVAALGADMHDTQSVRLILGGSV